MKLKGEKNKNEGKKVKAAKMEREKTKEKYGKI